MSPTDRQPSIIIIIIIIARSSKPFPFVYPKLRRNSMKPTDCRTPSGMCTSRSTAALQSNLSQCGAKGKMGLDVRRPPATKIMIRPLDVKRDLQGTVWCTADLRTPSALAGPSTHSPVTSSEGLDPSPGGPTAAPDAWSAPVSMTMWRWVIPGPHHSP